MEQVKASLLLVSKLEEIAWTLNLRGGDEPYSPIFISYLIITANTAELYIDPAKVPEEVEAYLEALGVVVKPYGDAVEGMKQQIKATSGSKIWLDPKLVSHSMFLAARDAFGNDVRPPHPFTLSVLL